MDSTTPKVNNITPNTGRMINEQDEIHNVVDDYGALKVIDVEHYGVHSGQSFLYTGTSTINAGASAYFLGRINNVTAHLYDFFIKADQAPITIQLFESPVISNYGALQTSINRNRQLLTPSTLSVYAGTVVTSDGVLLFTDKILGVQKDVTSLDLIGEWLLKKNTDYIFKLTNGSSQAANVVAGFNWLEAD